MQADFTQFGHGSLAVPKSDFTYIEKVRNATWILKEKEFETFATQDWHPTNHISFYTTHPGYKSGSKLPLVDAKDLPILDEYRQQKFQDLWPPHCVQGSKGSEILIPAYSLDHIVQKGANPKFDSYSGFRDDGGHETLLSSLLREFEVTELVIYGIAIDYCVKATVLDALRKNYKVSIIADLCRGVTVEGSKTALTEMERNGADIYETLEEYLSCLVMTKPHKPLSKRLFGCCCSIS